MCPLEYIKIGQRPKFHIVRVDKTCVKKSLQLYAIFYENGISSEHSYYSFKFGCAIKNPLDLALYSYCYK